MVRLVSITLIISILTPLASLELWRSGPAYGLVGRDTPLRPRTDRHNNPSAMIWTREREAFFRARGYQVSKGDPFPGTNRYHTLDMTLIVDPVKATIEYIDVHGFYTSYGRQRWEHTAMSLQEWRRLTEREKQAVIQAMYNKENLSKNKIFVSIYQEPGKIKPVRKKNDRPKRLTLHDKTIIPVRKMPAILVKQEKPAIETVFNKTFTDKDIDQYGNIKAFTWIDKYQIGDIIEITADLPDNAKEIYIYRGLNRTPKWKTTKNGYFRRQVEHVPIGKAYYIWLEKGKGIKAKVAIIRPS
jgi:hypothetical protein